MLLRVLSYNIRDGGGERLDALAKVIRRQRTDVIALLEANARENAELLARALDAQLAFGEANSGHHIAWLSHLPVARSVNHRQPGLAKTLLESDIVTPDGPLTLFATHLGSRWDIPQPADEVPIILDLLTRCSNPYLLVGDLNALRPGDPVGDPPDGHRASGDAAAGAARTAIQTVLAFGLVDCYRTLHPHDAGYTYPTHHPWLRLDYIFTSPDLAQHLQACEVVTDPPAAEASDHFPVVAEFRSST